MIEVQLERRRRVTPTPCWVGTACCLLAVLGMALLAACSDDATGPDDVAVYGLVAVNGQGLPALIVQEGRDRTSVTSGRIELRRDSTYSFILFYRRTAPEIDLEFSKTGSGTYSVRADSVDFMDVRRPPFGGQLAGDQLTVGFQGLSLLYRRG